MYIYLFILPHIGKNVFYRKKLRQPKMYFKNSTIYFQDEVPYLKTTLFWSIFLVVPFHSTGEAYTLLYKGGSPHYVRAHFKIK